MSALRATSPTGPVRSARTGAPGPGRLPKECSTHGTGGGQCGARLDLDDHQIDRVREQPRTQTGPPPRTSTEPDTSPQ
jgi:hypothetical protein